MLSVSSCHLPRERSCSPLTLHCWYCAKIQENSWEVFSLIDPVIFSKIMVKVASVPIWADLHFTLATSWKSNCLILYFLISYRVLLASSSSTRDQSNNLTLEEQRKGINPFPVIVTLLCGKSHGKVGNLDVDQSWILTAEAACFRDHWVYSQLLGCLGCVCSQNSVQNHWAYIR